MQPRTGRQHIVWIETIDLYRRIGNRGRRLEQASGEFGCQVSPWIARPVQIRAGGIRVAAPQPHRFGDRSPGRCSTSTLMTVPSMTVPSMTVPSMIGSRPGWPAHGRRRSSSGCRPPQAHTCTSPYRAYVSWRSAWGSVQVDRLSSSKRAPCRGGRPGRQPARTGGARGRAHRPIAADPGPGRSTWAGLHPPGWTPLALGRREQGNPAVPQPGPAMRSVIARTGHPAPTRPRSAADIEALQRPRAAAPGCNR